MKRDHWFHTDSNLLVEKYSKIINKEDFERMTGVLYLELDSSKLIKSLIDISDGNLFNINYGQISSIFDEFLIRIKNIENMQVAIFSGLNSKDDFLKISAFSKYESENVKIKNFVELRHAFEWLELNDIDIRKIKKQLQKEN